YTYDLIAKEVMGEVIPSYEELMGKKGALKKEDLQKDEYKKLCAYKASVYAKAVIPMMKKLAALNLKKLYFEIELPLVPCLFDMETEGIGIDAKALEEYGKSLEGEIARLQNSIYADAGEEFNINSPKQLGVILFEKLGLPGGKKTKTGYSTAADVLEKLAAEYPFVRDILSYRQHTKLKSTYAEGLASWIAKDGRIHTRFRQTVTATGRLSSTDPNLQNIPIRLPLGRMIRKVFIPREGCLFADADYSQIELRVLAALSGDERLIEAYRENRDIHRTTAALVFHKDPEDVTDLDRRNAKAVNFGIVYGISGFGLGEDLGISRKEAQKYIDDYFVAYPGLKKYIDDLVDFAKENGYALTKYERRRPIPELKSSNFMQRSFGERVAMNAPIQGTAADIIKIAMLRVYRRIKRENLSSRLLLQVHDELLIETVAEELDNVRTILEEEMKNAADLSVSLEIGESEGATWYDAK
nr:DNA polymerase I [Lachnospiraceae bacterium]